MEKDPVVVVIGDRDYTVSRSTLARNMRYWQALAKCLDIRPGEIGVKFPLNAKFSADKLAVMDTVLRIGIKYQS